MSRLDSQQPNRETVAALYELVQRLVDDERARGRTLDQKASTLAGFTAAMLALSAALGPGMLDSDLGGVGDVAVRVTFVVTTLALAASSGLSIAGVLRPQVRHAISTREVRQFGELESLARPPAEVHGNMLETLTDSFTKEREVNDGKARLTGHAVRALIVALGALTAQAAILTVAVG